VTGLWFAVRPYDGKQAAIRAVVSTMTSPLVEQHKPLLAQHGLHFRKANAVRRASHLVEELLPAGHSSSEKCEAALKPSRSNRRRRQRQEPEAESFGRPDARAEGFQEFARIGHFQQTVKTQRKKTAYCMNILTVENQTLGTHF